MTTILSYWEQLFFNKNIFTLFFDSDNKCVQVREHGFFSFWSSRKEHNLSLLTKLAATIFPKAATEPHAGMFSLSVDQPLNTPIIGWEVESTGNMLQTSSSSAG